MSNIDLKAYTRQAKELESAIYMQKKLMKEHEGLIDSQTPQKPVRKELSILRPVEQKPNYMQYTQKKEYKKELFLGIVWIALCITFISLFFVSDGFSKVFCIFMCLISGGVGYNSLTDAFNTISDNKEREKFGQTNYENAMETYNKHMEEYMDLVNSEKQKYENDCNAYEISLSKHNGNKNTIGQKHSEVLASLESALKQVYEKNIIFPKYRNFVAITAINEYLESGRCSTLEGADGAYNLYEMELRQNIVIGQLSNIISNLEQIRNNQFSLYEELKKSNEKIDDIIYELKVLQEDTKLNLYFNYVTALAETSPKITHGIVY